MKIEVISVQFLDYYWVYFYFKKSKNLWSLSMEVSWKIKCIRSGLKSSRQDFSLLYHALWSHRRAEVNRKEIKTLLENKKYTMLEISNIQKICKSSAESYLLQLCHISCINMWLRSFDLSVIFSRYLIFKLPFILIFMKFS